MVVHYLRLMSNCTLLVVVMVLIALLELRLSLGLRLRPIVVRGLITRFMRDRRRSKGQAVSQLVQSRTSLTGLGLDVSQAQLTDKIIGVWSAQLRNVFVE